MAEPHALSPVDAVVHNIPEVVELLPGAPGFVGSDSMPSASSFCGVHKGDAHTGGWTDPREAVLAPLVAGVASLQIQSPHVRRVGRTHTGHGQMAEPRVIHMAKQ